MRELFRTLIHRLAALFRGPSRRRPGRGPALPFEMAVELNLRKGMSAEEARREAYREFGGIEQTRNSTATREDYR